MASMQSIHCTPSTFCFVHLLSSVHSVSGSSRTLHDGIFVGRILRRRLVCRNAKRGAKNVDRCQILCKLESSTFDFLSHLDNF